MEDDFGISSRRNISCDKPQLLERKPDEILPNFFHHFMIVANTAYQLGH